MIPSKLAPADQAQAPTHRTSTVHRSRTRQRAGHGGRPRCRKCGGGGQQPHPNVAGEVSRTSAVTPRGVHYENITVSISGDKAQLFVPLTSIPRSAPVGVVWYYHANGSTYSAMNGAFKYSGELLVDQGAVCFCPNLGGSLWTSQAALNYHARAVSYLKNVFTIGVGFLRGNSGGGSMACWAYGKNLVPAAKGLYLANGTYDMEDLASRDPIRIAPVYGNSAAAIIATNPARLPSSSWTGKRIRVVVSDAAHPDIIVPPEKTDLPWSGAPRTATLWKIPLSTTNSGIKFPGRPTRTWWIPSPVG